MWFVAHLKPRASSSSMRTGRSGGALPKAGEKRDLKVASLTTPTATIANVLAIGWAMEDAR
jgi:hypothetical protein